jgi:hypothetical protein
MCNLTAFQRLAMETANDLQIDAEFDGTVD